MSITVAITILFVSFFIMMIIRVPVTFSLLGASVITCLYVNPALISSVFLRLGDGVQSFSFLAIPFFILAGDLMSAGGISDRLVAVADVLVGRFRGGLAYANVIDSTFFGGISGSPTADVSSLGSITIPMMEKNGYRKDFTIAITVATATQALLTMMILVRRMTIKENFPRGPKYTLKEALRTCLNGVLALITIVIIIVGCSSGIFTVTESAAIACVYAAFLTFVVYRSVKITEVWRILKGTLKTLAMILAIIASANAFCYLMSYLQVPSMITNFMLTVTDNKFVLLMMINVLLLVLGCFMDVAPLILITTPILLPAVEQFGVDPVHFGIIVMMNLAVGSLTPPVGTTLFAGCAVGHMSIEKVSKALIPFYICMVIVLLMVTYIPAVSMFLPNLLMGAAV